MSTKPRLKLLISYSHRDEEFREELETHLALLQRQNVISVWQDRKIGAGKDFGREISEELEAADIILLLVSSYFLASDYCYEIEMTRAMERHEADKARIIPIILRPCDWRLAPFGKLNALPKDAAPISGFDDQHEAFLQAAQGIRRAAEELSERRAKQASTQQAGQFPIWNVPHPRNPNFTGREDLLDQLQQQLTSGEPAALVQAIHGLGGVGKTQIAIEYAYRRRDDYRVVWWVRAEKATTLAADYAVLAGDLDLAEREAQEQQVTIEAVRRWLDAHDGWLLVFDNAERPKGLQTYLPHDRKGHVIVTSRNPAWGSVARPVQVAKMPEDEAIALLQRHHPDADPSAARALAKDLDYLPLAMVQASAYMEDTGTSLDAYRSLLDAHHKELMADGRGVLDYRDSVAAAWELSFNAAKTKVPASADLMNLCAFLAPEAIHLDLITAGQEHLPEDFATTCANPLKLKDTIAALRRYSLVETGDETLSVHRLVQAVARDRLSEDEQKHWARIRQAGQCSTAP